MIKDIVKVFVRCCKLELVNYSRWLRDKLHSLQANRSSLQIEIETIGFRLQKFQLVGGGEALCNEEIRLEAPLFQACIFLVVTQHSYVTIGACWLGGSEPQKVGVLHKGRGHSDSKEGIDTAVSAIGACHITNKIIATPVAMNSNFLKRNLAPYYVPLPISHLSTVTLSLLDMQKRGRFAKHRRFDGHGSKLLPAWLTTSCSPGFYLLREVRGPSF